MFNQLALMPPSMQLQYLIALQQQQNLQMQQPLGDCEEDDNDDDCDDEQLRTIFVANLDDRVDDELLYELFLQAGPLDSVRIPKDNNGKQRSFGFVKFTHECSAPYAMHLFKGLCLFGKTITLKYKNSASLPPLITERILPPHWGQKQKADDRPSCSYDNSALRRPNFGVFTDTAADDGAKSSSRDHHKSGNNDWALGRERTHRHRPHENSKPYQRHSGNDSFERPSGSERGHRGNDNQKRYAHSGNNRRAEQRNFRRI